MSELITGIVDKAQKAGNINLLWMEVEEQGQVVKNKVEQIVDTLVNLYLQKIQRDEFPLVQFQECC